MNEEEKKAVEFVKNLITWDEDLCPNKKECEQFETILNLMEKLQKENEELKNQEATARKINELLVQRYSNSISVQTVKDKIEKLNDESHAEELEDIMNRKNYTITELVQYVLQEIIKERSDTNENM